MSSLHTIGVLFFFIRNCSHWLRPGQGRAAKFNCRPSMIAHTLQGKRMPTIGVLLPELGEGYHSHALIGVGDLLIREAISISPSTTGTKRTLIPAYPDLLRSPRVVVIPAIDTHSASAAPYSPISWAYRTARPIYCQAPKAITSRKQATSTWQTIYAKLLY